LTALATGFQITLDGDDVSTYVDFDSVLVSSSVTVMTATCTFTVMIPDLEITRPISGQEVIITSEQGREFAGHIVSVEETQNGSTIGQLDYKVTCRDYAFQLNRHVAFNEFAAATVGAGGGYTYDEIVTALVNQYAAADGFTTNGVQSSYQAVYTRFDYQPVSDCINQLAQQIAWAYYVDYYRDVHFYDGGTTETTPLPNNTLQIDSATTITDSYGVYGQLGVYGDLTIKEDISQIRNRVYLYGHSVTANYYLTQRFTGDGNTTSFGLTYPPSQDLINNVLVTVGGGAYTCMVDLVDGTPVSTVQDYIAYINFTQQTVRFNVAPPAGTQIVVKYKPQLPIAIFFQDPSAAAVLAAQMGGDGYYEYAISDPTLNAETILPSQARAQEIMTKYGLPYLSGTFTSYLHGWQAGSYFTLKSAKRFSGQFATGQTMYVTKCEKKLVSHPTSSGATQPLFKTTVSWSSSVYVL